MKARNHFDHSGYVLFHYIDASTRREASFMDSSRLVFAIAGFSASFFLCLPNLKKWHRQQITTEKLRIISEALEQAEERAKRFQERHDRILYQMCSYYLTNQELGDALAGARAAMNEALEFAVKLREVQRRILINFPDEADLSLPDSPFANAINP